ncbi:putative CocE/NonD family hydrolase [Chromobacterium alkanivorans]|uniref:CocE/NonD family hydrolase n=1 Tax=Chromobacterium alkanivorans TaxID=1071719 RepID=UPI002169E95D|nr:CocE/NonD family hydrolase [Chromobacterium alkanivorans]MCS3802407.1 putative CocE/NonD family hydrolase [Chromobacterium alkanivorans]MCS3816734.1 putative CocE/NonD family hydrolase [Chromobacterium alkanivorans]MCS3871773.1 putative CocE/NonD family hydrolase [Chromobacterium alkanivorans]
MKTITQFPHAIREVEHFTITLADGCRLAARMWLPRDAEARPVPAILEYLPYRKRDGTAVRDQLTHPYFAGHGYACLRVDMRGCGESDGEFVDEYLRQEQDDALEVIAWIAAQPWCSGKVGMMGISWGGFNSLQVAARQPEALKAVITLCSTDHRYADDIHYKGGALLLENLGWAGTMLSYCAAAPDPLLVGEAWRERWLQRLERMPLLLKTWLSHQTDDDYWRHGSICADYGAIKAAVYAVGGWGDAYHNAVGRMMQQLSCPKKALIGPWAHKYPHFAVPDPAIGFLQEALRWWDYWLKDVDTGIMAEDPVTLYLQDAAPPQASYAERPGVWLRDPAWPSPHVRLQQWGLGAAGELRPGASDAGELGIRSPLSTGAACGEYCVIWLGPEFPLDQRRDDAGSLVFDSRALERELPLLGAPLLRLRLKCDSPSGQLAVRLNDVAPDGAATRISYGVLNLALRDGYQQPQAVTPGEWMEIRLQLDDCGYRLPAGHRLRLSISSAYFPLIWPAADHARLSLDLAGAELSLPVHDLSTEAAQPFAAPEAAPPLALSYLRPPANSREIIEDAMSGEVRTVIRDDFGHYRFDDHGLEVAQSCEEIYRILPDRPLSASGTVKWSYSAGRGDWRVRVDSELTLTADAGRFRIQARQSAWEGEQLLLRREWDEDVPRRVQ